MGQIYPLFLHFRAENTKMPTIKKKVLSFFSLIILTFTTDYNSSKLLFFSMKTLTLLSYLPFVGGYLQIFDFGVALEGEKHLQGRKFIYQQVMLNIPHFFILWRHTTKNYALSSQIWHKCTMVCTANCMS